MTKIMNVAVTEMPLILHHSLMAHHWYHSTVQSYKFCVLVTFTQLSFLSSPQAAEVKGAAVFCPDVPIEQIKAFSASAAAAPSSSCYSDFGNKHSIIFSARLTTPFIFFILPCLSFSSSLICLTLLVPSFSRWYCGLSRSAVPSRPHRTRTSGLVSGMLNAGQQRGTSWGLSHHKKTKERNYKSTAMLSVSPSSDKTTSPAALPSSPTGVFYWPRRPGSH